MFFFRTLVVIALLFPLSLVARPGILVVREAAPPAINKNVVRLTVLTAIKDNDLRGGVGSYDIFVRDLKASGLSDLKIEELLKKYVKRRSDGGAHVLYTQELWDALPDYHQEIVDSYFEKLPAEEIRKQLILELVVTPNDDLNEIAEKYGTIDRHKEIVRILSDKIKFSKSGFVTFPLQDILPKVIRDKVGSHEICNGPSCFTAALAVNEGENYAVGKMTSSELLQKLQTDNYRAVDLKKEVLGPQDILIYRDLAGEPVHLSAFITHHEGREIVFSKGGRGATQPYVFQWKETAEKAYFPDGKFALSVMHKNREGNAPPGSFGFLSSAFLQCRELLLDFVKKF